VDVRGSAEFRIGAEESNVELLPDLLVAVEAVAGECGCVEGAVLAVGYQVGEGLAGAVGLHHAAAAE
jgi:hypothetical protein